MIDTEINRYMDGARCCAFSMLWPGDHFVVDKLLYVKVDINEYSGNVFCFDNYSVSYLGDNTMVSPCFIQINVVPR